jgi:hypothetical protein
MTEPPVSRADHQGVRAAPVTPSLPAGAPNDAVLRLVQMVAGGSLGEAAGFLRIPTTRTTWQGRIYSGAGHVHNNAKKQPDPLAFEAAPQALAGELDEPATPCWRHIYLVTDP